MSQDDVEDVHAKRPWNDPFGPVRCRLPIEDLNFLADRNEDFRRMFSLPPRTWGAFDNEWLLDIAVKFALTTAPITVAEIAAIREVSPKSWRRLLRQMFDEARSAIGVLVAVTLTLIQMLQKSRPVEIVDPMPDEIAPRPKRPLVLLRSSSPNAPSMFGFTAAA